MVNSQFSLYNLINPRSIENIFTERSPLLTQWCRTIETTILDRHLSAEMYVCFQQLSNFALVHKRYSKINELGQPVWIFGEPDVTYTPQANLNFIELANGDKLCREWFLVVNHPDYSRAVVAQEISLSGTPLKQRLFQGVLTSDKDTVATLERNLARVVKDYSPII
ncbi:MAG: DICT sensory domain-containing protein [Chloroflexota bacterium]